MLGTYNEKVDEIVLENALGNAKYTSQIIQKKILQVLESKVCDSIQKETSDSKFCIIVDEARDESKREQMTLVLRFIDKEGFIKERFLNVVKDTIVANLKREICVLLAQHSLIVKNIWGQGYDISSKIHGEWNSL